MSRPRKHTPRDSNRKPSPVGARDAKHALLDLLRVCKCLPALKQKARKVWQRFCAGADKKAVMRSAAH